MTLERRVALQALLTGAMLHAKTYLIAGQTPPKQTLSINLAAIDRVEVLGPTGGTKYISVTDLWNAL